MRWERAPSVLWRRTPSHVVALRPETGDPDILSGAARDLWDVLLEPADDPAIEAELGSSWREVVDLLASSGLITRSSSRGGMRDDASSAASDGSSDPVATAVAPADRLVGAMTFWLPGAEGTWDEPLDAPGWEELLGRARKERCLGPLGWAVATGTIAATTEQREEIERYAILGARRAVTQERDLLRVVDLLESSGIEVRVLKGSAVAHLDHMDPSFRASADHDLLVRGSDVDTAVGVLLDDGYVRELPERRPGFDRDFAKDVTMQRLDRAEVDLHRLPLAGPLGLDLDLDALWSEASSFDVGGRSLKALDPTSRFCHAAWSLALTDPAPRLVPALDMVAINVAHGVDAARLEELAPRGRGRGAIGLAIDLAGRLLGRPDLLPPASQAADRREERAIGTYPGLGGSKAGYLLAGARSIPSRRARVRYLWALLAPSAAYRRARRDKARRPEWRLATQGAARRLRRRGS